MDRNIQLAVFVHTIPVVVVLRPDAVMHTRARDSELIGGLTFSTICVVWDRRQTVVAMYERRRVR